MSDKLRQERRQEKRLPYSVTPISDINAYRREQLLKENKWELTKADRLAAKKAKIERLWDNSKGIYKPGEVVETDATIAFKALGYKRKPLPGFPDIIIPLRMTKWETLKQKCYDLFMSLPLERY